MGPGSTGCPKFERGESEGPTHCRLHFFWPIKSVGFFRIALQRTPEFNDPSRCQPVIAQIELRILAIEKTHKNMKTKTRSPYLPVSRVSSMKVLRKITWVVFCGWKSWAGQSARASLRLNFWICKWGLRSLEGIWGHLGVIMIVKQRWLWDGILGF